MSPTRRFGVLCWLLTAVAATHAAPVVAGGATPAPAVDPATTPAEPTAPPATDGPPAATPEPGTDDPAPTDAVPQIVDVVLPCGVRVIVAEDLTLPVAAVVLAVETGTEDDPSDTHGLVHALAYHLLQGNRDHAPGGIARAVHGTGGTTSLAIGPAQVRYESLVPASMLGDTIAAEASRLRAPTVSEPLWKDTLRWAKRDKPRAWSVPAALRADAHQAEGLRHDGHVVSDAVANLSERAVSTQLAERFGYDRATLVVVAPVRPEVALVLVTKAFSDLPAATRQARERTAPPHSGAVPRQATTKGSAPGAFVWPIPGDTQGQAWAEVVCGTLNRLRRGADEPGRLRVRCAIDDDPRRGVMVVKASGVDDLQAAVAARLQRVRQDEAEHLTKERVATAERLRYAVRTPLALARHLARARLPGPPPGSGPMRTTAELVGHAALAEATALPEAYAHLLELGAATVAAPASKPKAGDAP